MPYMVDWYKYPSGRTVSCSLSFSYMGRLRDSKMIWLFVPIGHIRSICICIWVCVALKPVLFYSGLGVEIKPNYVM